MVRRGKQRDSAGKSRGALPFAKEKSQRIRRAEGKAATCNEANGQNSIRRKKNTHTQTKADMKLFANIECIGKKTWLPVGIFGPVGKNSCPFVLRLAAIDTRAGPLSATSSCACMCFTDVSSPLSRNHLCQEATTPWKSARSLPSSPPGIALKWINF